MVKIHSLYSDLDLQKEFVNDLKKRNISQKFLYMDE
jgi:hypothetical protein